MCVCVLVSKRIAENEFYDVNILKINWYRVTPLHYFVLLGTRGVRACVEARGLSIEKKICGQKR